MLSFSVTPAFSSIRSLTATAVCLVMIQLTRLFCYSFLFVKSYVFVIVVTVGSFLSDGAMS